MLYYKGSLGDWDGVLGVEALATQQEDQNLDPRLIQTPCRLSGSLVIPVPDNRDRGSLEQAVCETSYMGISGFNEEALTH